MKKMLIVSATMLLSLFTFTRCDHENGGENGGGNGNTDNPCAVVDADGNCYDTVHIGNQIWMKSNLRTTHFRDGSPIPLGSGTNTAGPWYFHPSTADAPGYSSETYGLYYSEEAVHDTRGLCPAGWHVPTVSDWEELGLYVSTHYEDYFNFVQDIAQDFVQDYYGFDDWEWYLEAWEEDYEDLMEEGLNSFPHAFPIAKVLASQAGWAASEFMFIWYPTYHPEYNNTTGFSVYPAGLIAFEDNPPIYGYGEAAFLWSSTKHIDDDDSDEEGSWVYEIDGDEYYFAPQDKADNNYGLSVRCVKD